jgi:hypothetical protein
MDVELLHHYGWDRHQTSVATLEDAAYAAVRDTHTFLTDTNHTHTAGDRGGYSNVRIYRGEGAPSYNGPPGLDSDYWFTVQYRAPTGDSSHG